MLSCESCQNLMADALYEALNEHLDGELQAHLAGCTECRAIREELLSATEGLQGAGVASGSFDDIPERASLDDLWQRIEPELNKIDAERYHRLPRRNLAPWALALTAIAASVLVFVSVGTPTGNDPEPAPIIVSTEGISPELMNYLDRAQVMLMQVANSDSDNRSVIPVTNTFAREMAFEANLLHSVGNGQVNPGQRRLLRDIEFLLLQVANLDDSNLEEGVALLQQFLEENNILFKIRLLEMRDQELVI